MSSTENMVIQVLTHKYESKKDLSEISCFTADEKTWIEFDCHDCTAGKGHVGTVIDSQRGKFLIRFDFGLAVIPVKDMGTHFQIF